MKSEQEVKKIFAEEFYKLKEAWTEARGLRKSYPKDIYAALTLPQVEYGVLASLKTLERFAQRIGIIPVESSEQQPFPSTSEIVPDSTIEPDIEIILRKKLCSAPVTPAEEHSLTEFMNTRTTQQD